MMKTKLLLIITLLIFGFVSCDKEKTKHDPEIKIDIPTISIPTADTKNVTAIFTVNMPWTLELTDTKGTPSWFTVDKTSGGAGTHTIIITIREPNPSTTQIRSGYINILAEGKTATITVNQPMANPDSEIKPEPEIKIDIPTISIPTADTKNVTAIFTVNIPWTLELTDTKGTPSWFTVDKTSGGAGTHTIILNIIEPNPSTTQIRSGYINIIAGEKSAIITVNQPFNEIINEPSLPDRDNERW